MVIVKQGSRRLLVAEAFSVRISETSADNFEKQGSLKGVGVTAQDFDSLARFDNVTNVEISDINVKPKE